MKRTVHDRSRSSRLLHSRSALAERLVSVLTARPDVLTFRFGAPGLPELDPALEAEGLVHACMEQEAGQTTILAAATRIMRDTRLRRRLLDIRQLAERRGLRVVVATSRSLRNDLHRLRRIHRRLRSPPTAKRWIPNIRDTEGHPQ